MKTLKRKRVNAVRVSLSPTGARKVNPVAIPGDGRRSAVHGPAFLASFAGFPSKRLTADGNFERSVKEHLSMFSKLGVCRFSPLTEHLAVSYYFMYVLLTLVLKAILLWMDI